MATSLQQYKLDLVENILGMEDLKKVKAVTAFVEDLEKPKPDDRLSLDDLLRQGEEDIAAGRVYTWEETKKAALQAIKKGGEEYRRRNGEAA